MDAFRIPTYGEYKLTKIKYSFDSICGVANCSRPGLYEGGDIRCWCPMCEEHAHIKAQYERHVHDIRHREHIRKLWTRIVKGGIT